jgi:hypothetical protein
MEIDADTILSIPIREDFEDFAAWQFDKKGLFQSNLRTSCMCKSEMGQVSLLRGQVSKISNGIKSEANVPAKGATIHVEISAQ